MRYAKAILFLMKYPHPSFENTNDLNEFKRLIDECELMSEDEVVRTHNEIKKEYERELYFDKEWGNDDGEAYHRWVDSVKIEESTSWEK